MRFAPEDAIHVPASLEPYLLAQGTQSQKKTKSLPQQAAAATDEPEEAAAPEGDSDLTSILTRLTCPAEIYQARYVCTITCCTNPSVHVRSLRSAPSGINTPTFRSVWYEGTSACTYLSACVCTTLWFD